MKVPEKIKKNKITLGTLTTIMGAILLFFTFQEKIESKWQQHTGTQIEVWCETEEGEEFLKKKFGEYLKDRPGGFRSDIIDELTERELFVGDNHALIHYVCDVLEAYEIKKDIVDVGLKIVNSKKIYLHTDGEYYQPLYQASVQRHWFHPSDEAWEYCQ